MTTTAPSRIAPRPVRPPTTPDHRWLILAIIGVAQLMVVLDATIVNIALPSAQRDLGFGTDGRQWVVTGYALAFGSLLLLGGRLSDKLGRRVTLLTGLLGFAAASALGGAAPSFGWLIAARLLQGVFAAVLAPAALSTLNVTFTDRVERARALGIYAAIAASGAVVGLIVGGMLTEWLSWRWCLYVNLVFAGPAALGVLTQIRSRRERQRLQLDLPGGLTATGGVFGLVYGLSHAAQHGWMTALTIAPMAVGAGLLTGFVFVERYLQHPLLPLRVLADRNRAGAYLAIAVGFMSAFGLFLFLTYFLQQTLGYGPLRAGVAFLPLSVGIMLASGLSNTRLTPRFGPRPLVPTGLLVAAAAMLWLARLSPSSGYASGVLGPMFVFGVGLGLAFATSIVTATSGIDRGDAGVSSAMVSTSQQIGGAIGTAVLSTVFSSALSDYLTSHRAGPALVPAATVHGYSVAFLVAACVLAGGAVATAALLRSGRLDSEPVSSY